MKASDRTIEEWFPKILSGQVQLPRFQRFEAWGHRDVEDLLQTVIHGLPAGATLVLQVGAQVPFKHRPIETAPVGDEPLNELLLDGQQRLTALWRSLNGTFDNRAYFVELDAEDEYGDGLGVVSQNRWIRNGKRYPMWVDSSEQVLHKNLIPIHLLRPGNAGESEFNAWIEETTAGDVQRQIELLKIGNRLRNRIATFNLPYLSLPIGTSKSVVLDVFVKMNTRLVKLSAFDIIVAEIEGTIGESLHDMVASLQGQVPALARYGEPADIVLNVAALLQDRSPNRAGQFGVEWGSLLEDDGWGRIVAGAQSTVEFLAQHKVFDDARLPTNAVLAPLVALWSMAPTTPDMLGSVRRLLGKYLWFAFLTERYERNTSSNTLQDYRAIRAAVLEGKANAAAPIFDLPLPDASELLQVGWPKRRDRLARAILLLSFQGGALDLADGTPITVDTVGRREYHHLFPVAYLRDRGIEERDASVALNCALITWRTNRTIGAQEPVRYLRERAEAAESEDVLMHRLDTHAIPYGSMAASDFDGFVLERAELMEKLAIAVSDGHTANL